MAKHHNLPGIASRGDRSGTRPYRGRGAGGILLPNHAPRLIAEQFGTLAALHPGRVDLGLGHAPGSDQVTAQAMRRTLHSSGDDFPHDVVELMVTFRLPNQGKWFRRFLALDWTYRFGFLTQAPMGRELQYRCRAEPEITPLSPRRKRCWEHSAH